MPSPYRVALVGLGIRELSMAPSAIPRVKAALRAVSAERAREVAGRCLLLPDRAEIEALLRQELPAEVLASPPARRREAARPRG